MPNRYVCDVLREMRKCDETRNYSFLPGLIEEAQTMFNRMEARLEDYAGMIGDTENIYTKKLLLREMNDERHLLYMQIEKLKYEMYEALSNAKNGNDSEEFADEQAGRTNPAPSALTL